MNVIAMQRSGMTAKESYTITQQAYNKWLKIKKS